MHTSLAVGGDHRASGVVPKPMYAALSNPRAVPVMCSRSLQCDQKGAMGLRAQKPFSQESSSSETVGHVSVGAGDQTIK